MRYLALALVIWVGFFTHTLFTDSAVAPQGLHGEAAPYAEVYAKNAERFWEKRGGFENCPQGVELVWAPLDWIIRSGGAGAAWANLNGCTIYINMYMFRNQSPAKRCHTLIHEWGHLVGLHHEDNPNHVMYYKGKRPHPSCERFNRRSELWIIYDLYETGVVRDY